MELTWETIFVMTETTSMGTDAHLNARLLKLDGIALIEQCTIRMLLLLSTSLAIRSVEMLTILT